MRRLGRLGWPQPAALAATALMLLAACGTDNSAEIVEIHETNDPLVVDVIIDTCNADVDEP